jgi:hypothetical protein
MARLGLARRVEALSADATGRSSSIACEPREPRGQQSRAIRTQDDAAHVAAARAVDRERDPRAFLERRHAQLTAVRERECEGALVVKRHDLALRHHDPPV